METVNTENLTELTVSELLEGFSRKHFSPIEMIEAVFDRITRLNGILGAFLSLTLDSARLEARSAERRFVRGEPIRPLEGVPIAAKDIFDTADVRTTYGSSMFSNHRPRADAAAITALRGAGAIVVGKTATHEFAWGITSVNPHFGVCRNPWALDRISGGSSGGSAVAVAAHLAPAALGSDTGGSTRIPAAFCGVVGFKPTYGRVDTAGMLALAPSLDHVGVLTRSPADAALLLAVLAPLDQTRESKPGNLVKAMARPAPSVLRVGICRDLHFVPLVPEIERVFEDALRMLAAAGLEVEEVRHREAGNEYEVFQVIQFTEAIRAHRSAGLFPAQSDRYGADIRGRLERAATLTENDYLAACKARDRISRRYRRLFEDVDLLVTPVAPCLTPEIGDDAPFHHGAREDLRNLVMPYTIPQNLTGLPACSVRAGIDSQGLPVAVQFTGRPGADMTVLQAAAAFFDATRTMQMIRPQVDAPALATTSQTSSDRGAAEGDVQRTPSCKEA